MARRLVSALSVALKAGSLVVVVLLLAHGALAAKGIAFRPLDALARTLSLGTRGLFAWPAVNSGVAALVWLGIAAVVAVLTRRTTRARPHRPASPGKPAMPRASRVLFIAVGVLTVLETAAFASSYFLYSSHYVTTDNAQVDGDKIDINAPVSGAVSDWAIQSGSVVEPNQIVGRIRVLGSGGQPERPVKVPGASTGTVAADDVVDGSYVTAGTELATAYDLGAAWRPGRRPRGRVPECPGALLDVRVFTHWPFINSLLLIAILSIGLFAVLSYVPLFLQEGQDLTPWHTGLVLLPQALVMMAMMPATGRIYDRIGPRWPAVIGLTLCGVGTLLLIQINIDLTRPELITWMMIRAAGLGLAMMPIMTGGLSALPADIVSSGSAFNTLTQRVTASFGLAALTALATAQQAQFMSNRGSLLSTGANTDPRIVAMRHQGPGGLIGLWQRTQIEVEAQAYSNVFLIAGVCTLGGVLLALRLRSGKPSRVDRGLRTGRSRLGLV